MRPSILLLMEWQSQLKSSKQNGLQFAQDAH
jgi:hypothetical protein